MKALILYYSYSGNTRNIAKLIQREIGGDIAEIKTVKPYEGNYNDVVNQGKYEIDSGFMPAIQPIDENIEDYDTIILGSPVWWYTFAPAVHTFLKEYPLTGKTVYPFATNGGWIGHTFADFEKLCVGAAVKQGINIRFDEEVLRTPENEIKRWANEIQ